MAHLRRGDPFLNFRGIHTCYCVAFGLVLVSDLSKQDRFTISLSHMRRKAEVSTLG